MSYLSSNSSVMMEKSMNFLWAKQAAILDNIANVETPNYKAKVVTFEEDLRSKLESAQSGAMPVKTARKVLDSAEFKVEDQQESTRMDDNGVNIVEQSTEMVRNAYQLEYVMRSIDSDLARLRTAVRGQ